MLTRKVLIRNISNLSEARYCSGMGVAKICFEIDHEHPDYVDFDRIKEIRTWLSGIEIGVSIDSGFKDWKSLKEQNFDFLLIKCFEPKITVPDFDGIIIYESRLESIPDTQKEIVIKTDENTLHQLKNLKNPKDTVIYLDMAWDKANLALLNQMDENIGLVLFGIKEERPGFSSYENLMEVLEYLDELD